MGGRQWFTQQLDAHTLAQQIDFQEVGMCLQQLHMPFGVITRALAGLVDRRQNFDHRDQPALGHIANSHSEQRYLF